VNKNLVAVFLILLSAFASAHTIEGDFEGITFQGETVESTFLLCNTSDSSENFHINSSNPWMQLRPLSVYLSGNSCEEIYAFTTPAPYAESGEYEIEVTASADKSVSETFYLEVVEGHKIRITPFDDEISTTQCAEKVFEFELENTGIFDERALISVEGLNENWFELSSEEILLPKGEEREIELTINIPCNQEIKVYEFKLLVELKNTGIIKEQNLELNIEDGQGILIESKEFASCNDWKTENTIALNNEGMLSDALTVELQGLDFVVLKENSFSLGPGEIKELNLEFNKTELEQGNYTFKLRVYSEKFNQVYEREFELKLENCYDLSIEKAAFQDSACIESKPEVSFIIRNNGTRKTEVRAGLEGINAVLEKNSFSLEAGESVEVRVELDLEGKTGETSFLFIADSEEFTKTIENTISIEDCYETESTVPSIEVCREIPLQGKEIVIRNTGTRKQYFNVSSNVEWIKLKEKTFEIEGLQEKVIPLIITPGKDASEESYSILTKTENNSYTMKASINYLDKETCFGIEMTNLKSFVNVNAGEGAINTIKVTNKGKTIQTVYFRVEPFNWVYFNPKEINIESGETKEIYVYFNPPFDFAEETATATVKAETNYGFTAEQEVEVHIFGGSVILTINPEDIKVNPKGLDLEDTKENTVEIKIEVENNTETNMKILGVKTPYTESKYVIEEPVIKKGEKGEITLRFVASEELELSGLEVPIEIITDKGTYYKIVTLPAGETEDEKEDEKKSREATTGFVLFGEDQYVLVILIVAVVILIIMAAVRTEKEDEKEQVVDYGTEKELDKVKNQITQKAAGKTPFSKKGVTKTSSFSKKGVTKTSSKKKPARKKKKK